MYIYEVYMKWISVFYAVVGVYEERPVQFPTAALLHEEYPLQLRHLPLGGGGQAEGSRVITLLYNIPECCYYIQEGNNSHIQYTIMSQLYTGG